MYEVERLVVRIVGDATSFNSTIGGAIGKMADLSKNLLRQDQISTAQLISNSIKLEQQITASQRRINSLVEAGHTRRTVMSIDATQASMRYNILLEESQRRLDKAAARLTSSRAPAIGTKAYERLEASYDMRLQKHQLLQYREQSDGEKRDLREKQAQRAIVGAMNEQLRLKNQLADNEGRLGFFNSFHQRLGRFVQEAKIKFAELVQGAQQLGSNLTRYVTLPFLAIGALSIREFARFDKAITKTMAFSGETNRSGLEGIVMSISKNSARPIYDTAESLYDLASAGYDTAQSIAALPVVEKFATASGMSMSDSTKSLTQSLKALGLASEDPIKNMQEMLRLTDNIVKADSLASASSIEFATALQNKFGSQLRLTNKSLEEGMAILAAYAEQGIKGSEAGEYGNRLLRDLQIAAVKHAEAWKVFNMSIYDNGKMRNIADILKQFEKTFAGASDEQKRQVLLILGMNSRNVDVTSALLGKGDAVAKFQKDFENAGGTLEKVSSKIRESISEQLGILWNRIKMVGVQIGGAFIPTLKTLMGLLTGLSEKFDNLDPATKTLIVNIGAAVAIIGPLLLLSGSLLNAFIGLAAIAGWPVIFAAGIAGLWYYFGSLGSTIENLGTTWTESWDSIKKSIEKGEVQGAFKTFTASLSVTWREMLNSFIFDLAIFGNNTGMRFASLGIYLKALWLQVVQGAALKDDNGKMIPGNAFEVAATFAANWLDKSKKDFLNQQMSAGGALDLFGAKDAHTRLDETMLESNPDSKVNWIAGIPDVINKMLDNSLKIKPQLGFSEGFSEAYGTRNSGSDFNFGKKSPWDIMMDSMHHDLSGQMARSYLETILPEKGFLNRWFGDLTGINGNNDLQSKIDLFSKHSDQDFKEISLAHFEVRGPGGLATDPRKIQETFSPNTDNILERIEAKLPAPKGGAHERLTDTEE